MKSLATVVLLIAQLTGLARHLSPEALTNLRAVSLGQLPPSNARPISPAAHHNLATPVLVGTTKPTLGAAAAYAMDVDTGQPLYSQNAAATLPIASITKLITALVIVRDHQLAETVTVPALPSYQPGDELMGLAAGQKFTVGDLLTAALVPSANDAADSLALWDAGSTTAFAAKMNRLAAHWGITGARFTNPTGLVDTGNGASAEALAKLAKLGLANPDIARRVALPAAVITNAAGHTYNLTATDQLLQDGRFSGIKTGYTLAAGQSFVGLATLSGHRVITVVLNSPDRFGETRALADWIERNYTWQ